MDTREKILSPQQALVELAQGNWLVVAGYFDPVTAGVAEGLHDLVQANRERKVVAVVLDGPETLLSAEARSVLVAALRDVQVVVVMPEEDLNGFVPQNSRIRFVFDREAERKNSTEFASLVLAKERLQDQSRELGL